jgi:hypothetical protein
MEPFMTAKNLQIKKNQHYVWADYLSRWSPDNDCKIYHISPTGKIVLTHVNDLAKQDYFYQIKDLTGDEIAIMKIFLKPLSEDLQNIHISFLNDILEIQNEQFQYKKNGENNEEIQTLFFAKKCNIIEDFHAGHEKKAIPILDSLATGELSILEDDKNMASFMEFLGHQLLRTKKIKDIVIRKQPRKTNLEKIVADAMQNIWWFTSYIFGVNLGKSLYLGRHEEKHSLLINETDISFITSDQPIINVHECVSEDNTIPPEHMNLYYPITPRIAYMINEAGQFKLGKISVAAAGYVNELNIKTAKKSNTDIFGNSKLTLSKYINSFNSKNCL